MTENQKNALKELKEIHLADPENLAVIICGSIAREDSRPDSDIDLYIVKTDKAFEKISEEKSYFYGTWDPKLFFGVEIDGKNINLQYLIDAVEKANEPTRESFRDSYCLFSHLEEIPALLKKIAVYPVDEHLKRVKAFIAYTRHYRYVGEDAFNQKNDFHFKECINQEVFFAARLCLAYNKILYPCKKGLFKALAQCDTLPVNFIEDSQRLIAHPNLDSLISYYEKVSTFFVDYEYSDEERIGMILENEWTWFTGNLTIEEW